MVNSSDVALIVSVESNENNINLMTKTISVQRFYEDEAIRCFKSWRKNGGWLKDIDIYCVCPSKNTIKQTTKDEFKKLNVEYVEYFDQNIFDYSSGFLTLPFVGQLFENKVNISQNILIKIDLDMQLLKPLPEEWFNEVELGYTVIGQYDVYSIRDQRNAYRDFLPFDTGLMITDKRNMFCDLWYKLCFLKNLSLITYMQINQQRYFQFSDINMVKDMHHLAHFLMTSLIDCISCMSIYIKTRECLSMMNIIQLMKK